MYNTEYIYVIGQLAARLREQHSSLPHMGQIKSQPFSPCHEANNGRRFISFHRRTSFFGSTLSTIQENSTQHSGMPKETTGLPFQRKHLRNRVCPWQNNISHEMGFLLAQAQNNAALWQASWSADCLLQLYSC